MITINMLDLSFTIKKFKTSNLIIIKKMEPQKLPFSNKNIIYEFSCLLRD